MIKNVNVDINDSDSIKKNEKYKQLQLNYLIKINYQLPKIHNVHFIK